MYVRFFIEDKPVYPRAEIQYTGQHDVSYSIQNLQCLDTIDKGHIEGCEEIWLNHTDPQVNIDVMLELSKRIVFNSYRDNGIGEIKSNKVLNDAELYAIKDYKAKSQKKEKTEWMPNRKSWFSAFDYVGPNYRRRVLLDVDELVFGTNCLGGCYEGWGGAVLLQKNLDGRFLMKDRFNGDRVMELYPDLFKLNFVRPDPEDFYDSIEKEGLYLGYCYTDIKDYPYELHILGNDDSSYTQIYQTEQDMRDALKLLKDLQPLSLDDLFDLDFFFTN